MWLLKSFISPATSLIHLFRSLSSSSPSPSILLPFAILALSVSIHVFSCSQAHSSLLLPCPLSFLKETVFSCNKCPDLPLKIYFKHEIPQGFPLQFFLETLPRIQCKIHTPYVCSVTQVCQTLQTRYGPGATVQQNSIL